MGLKPAEFWRLTPAEFWRLVDGWAWRDRREREVLAMAGLGIVAANRSKRGIRHVRKILGWTPNTHKLLVLPGTDPAAERPMEDESPEERRAVWERMQVESERIWRKVKAAHGEIR